MLLSELDLSKTYSYADYITWPFEERVELFNGKVVAIDFTNRLHQALAGNIYASLLAFLKNQPCSVYIAPFDVRFIGKTKDDKDIVTVLQPDVCVVCDLTKLDDKGCVGAPDIVVEVLSPGNSAKELKNKYQVYEENGVREYWVAFPQNETLLVYTLTDGKYQPSPAYTNGDEVRSTVLPGFSLNLTELFQQAKK